jgi:hypothetical protein
VAPCPAEADTLAECGGRDEVECVESECDSSRITSAVGYGAVEDGNAECAVRKTDEYEGVYEEHVEVESAELGWTLAAVCRLRR